MAKKPAATKKSAATKAKSKQKVPKPSSIASIFPGSGTPLDDQLTASLAQLAAKMDLPIWLLVQAGGTGTPLDFISEQVWDRFVEEESRLPSGKPVALIIDSPGGFAKQAYQIARLLTQRCGSFTAVVPRSAKSASTLLVLGAEKIIMGRHAELGPLDAQLRDPEREEITSALEIVHSLRRLHVFAMESLDQTMSLMLPRTRKKVETLLPFALDYTANMMAPLLNKIDVVEYTKMSRILKVAEEYAARLLLQSQNREDAERIARHLVEHYPDHPFFIAPEEAEGIGLNVEKAAKALDNILDDIYHYLQQSNTTLLGEFREEVNE